MLTVTTTLTILAPGLLFLQVGILLAIGILIAAAIGTAIMHFIAFEMPPAAHAVATIGGRP
jgi:hypothetical protein